MKRTVLQAYHQVGGDDRSVQERKRYMERILSDGEITPASHRIRRSEMHEECFGDAQGSQDIASFTGASRESREALLQMARERVDRLPARGTTHTMFNCLDLLVGDFENVFLSIGNWYSHPNGFVFDAEELIDGGAVYRPRDLLGFYRFKLEQAASLTYDSVADARREFEDVIRTIRDEHEASGAAAKTLLRNDCAEECPGEIVWPGPLPLGLAIEMWREGRQVRLSGGGHA